MKKYLAVLLCGLTVLSLLTGCRKEPETYSSWYSYIEVEDEADDEAESNATSSNNRIVYDSTIQTPKYMTLYKGGMQTSVKDKSLRLKAAKEIEKLFYDYANDNLPSVDMEVTRQFIWELKQNETVIELRFELAYQEKLNLLGKINLEKTHAVLVPVTGKYAYYLFSGYDIDRYTNKPYKLKGSGHEKIFEGITLDTKVRTWESTVEAPVTVTFYKDGATAVSTDKELNLKIAQHIENWFKYKQLGMGLSWAATTDTLRPIKYNEMAVELQFDDEILFFGQTEFKKDSRTIFIPVTGEHANIIFSNSIRYPDSWTGPIYGGSGLNQFFDYVQFTPLTEEEKRWRSTVCSASEIKAYAGETLLGESSKYSDYTLNYEVMQHIERWFYHKETIHRLDTGIADVNLNNIRATEKYLEIYFGSPEPTFYGQHVISQKTSYMLIPLTGEYAYYIFEGNYQNFSPIAIVPEGSDLEKYFEAVKAKGVDDDPQDLYDIVDDMPEED